jgi:biopolymer transport protein ExbB
MDTLAAGGSIAYVIALMGVIAMVMVLIRYVLLQRAGKVDETELSKACESLSGEDLKGNYAVSRVVKKILNNKEVGREAREDIINESILSEISLIDKFGTMILVMAAVAPLLGLLGTVTGMISTFDIITEFGTGDPKMLSSGISEALITTKLGLMVAIPTLLLGNMLGSKASKIKLTLECEAMKFANLIETKKELA